MTRQQFDDACRRADAKTKETAGHAFVHILKTRCYHCGLSPKQAECFELEPLGIVELYPPKPKPAAQTEEGTVKPFYEHAGITIYHGDCREVLPSMEFDVLVTDPPYGIGLGVDKDMRGGEHGLAKKPYESYEDTVENFRAVVAPWVAWTIKESKRAAVFMAGHRIHDLPRPDAIGGVYCPAAIGRNCWGFNSFLLVCFYGKDPKLNGGDTPTAIESCAVADKNGHPCPKPDPRLEQVG